MIQPGKTKFVVYGSEGVVGKCTRMILRHLGFDVFRIDPKLYNMININIESLMWNELHNEIDSVIKFFNKQDLIFIICIPTNLDPKTATLDTNKIFDIVQSITERYGKEANIIIRSTLPVGTCKELSRFCYNLCYIPEFLTERTALRDSIMPDRIIIGYNNLNNINSFAFRIHDYLLVRCNEHNISMGLHSFINAECIKLFQNMYAANKVIMFNVFSQMTKQLGGDWSRIHIGLITSKFINKDHTQVPGPDKLPGYGGKCLPKDTLNILTQYTNNTRTFDALSEEETQDMKIRNLICDYLHGMIFLNNQIRNKNKKQIDENK